MTAAIAVPGARSEQAARAGGRSGRDAPAGAAAQAAGRARAAWT